MRRAYVGNIPFSTTEDDLRSWFAPYQLLDVAVVHDKNTGRPRGFAFVEFSSQELLDEVIRKYDGRELGGRRVLVNDATEKKRGG